MRLGRRILLVVVPVTAGLATVALRGWSSGDRKETATPAPVVDVPALVDCGEQESGKEFMVPVAVANRGTAELLVSDIKTDCGCSGLVREEDGRIVAVKSLRLAPGGVADLRVQAIVRGAAGESATHIISFRTNDPKRLEGGFQVRVPRIRGGYFTVPASVAFGGVAANAVCKQIVEVFDFERAVRPLKKASATRPDRCRVALLPLSDADQKRDDAGRKVIGRVEVEVGTDKPGPLNAEILLFADGAERPTGVVPVSGRILAPIEVSPSVLALPRQSGSGPIYTASCICRSTSGKSMALSVAAAPHGFSVSVKPSAGNAALAIVAITLAREAVATDGTAARIRLRAKSGEHTSEVEIPVYVTRGQP